jgi:hypothetical protein
MSAIADGHVYVTPPIDWWVGWMRVEDLRVRGADEHEEARIVLATVEPLVEHARRELLNRTGWDGEASDGPFVAGMPPIHGGSESDVMIAFKAVENGLAYIWSPHRLDYLDEFRPEVRSPPKNH